MSAMDFSEADLRETVMQAFCLVLAEAESHQPALADTSQEPCDSPRDVATDANEQQCINAFFSKQPCVPGQGQKQALPPGNINRLMSPTKKPGPK